MAEQIISPGVFQNENAPVVLAAAAAPLGAAIVGPTVKGQIGIPTVVSTYSEYLQKFGGSFVSGGFEQTYFTALSAQNYFRQGGTSLTVVRVASGSANFTAGDSTTIQNNDIGTSGILNGSILATSITANTVIAGAGHYHDVALTGGAGTGAIATVTTTGTTAPTVTSIEVTAAGTGYAVGNTLTIAASALGEGQLINTDDVIAISAMKQVHLHYLK